MSTDIALIPDALDPEHHALEVYAGTGGIALYCHEVGLEGHKVWLDAAGVDALIAALQVARGFLR